MRHLWGVCCDKTLFKVLKRWWRYVKISTVGVSAQGFTDRAASQHGSRQNRNPRQRRLQGDLR